MPVDLQTAERLLDELLDAHSVYQHAYDAELKDARWKYKETRAAVLSAMTVSEGWKLVPVVPTQRMADVWFKTAHPDEAKTWAARYAAMLAAAPKVPA